MIKMRTTRPLSWDRSSEIVEAGRPELPQGWQWNGVNPSRISDGAASVEFIGSGLVIETEPSFGARVCVPDGLRETLKSLYSEWAAPAFPCAPDADWGEWGKVAASIPGWDYMPGAVDTRCRVLSYQMQWMEADGSTTPIADDDCPMVDQWGNHGVMIALLSISGPITITTSEEGDGSHIVADGSGMVCEGKTLGRALVTMAWRRGEWAPDTAE